MSEKPPTTQEVLVLDSSTFIQEAGLTSSGSSALKHYLRHRGTLLVVPEVVTEECERTLVDITNGKIARINEILTWLGRFFGRVNGWTPPRDDIVKERAKLLAKADHLRAIVLPETQAIRRRAELRAQLQKPPSHERPEPNDCRIWEQCLELLKNHDVVFVSHDRDFRGHQRRDELHPQLRAEAKAVGSGRSLKFHPTMESLLNELKCEVPAIPKDKLLAFAYGAVATDIDELKSGSGYRPKGIEDVAHTFLTTDDADVVEVRLEVNDRWEHLEDGGLADFHLRASCHYHLTDRELRDLQISNLRLLVPQSDGSFRAARGSYVNARAGTLYVGPAPIETRPEVLGQRTPFGRVVSRSNTTN